MSGIDNSGHSGRGIGAVGFFDGLGESEFVVEIDRRRMPICVTWEDWG